MILSSMEADTVLHHILLIVRNYFGVATCAVFLTEKAKGELFCRAQNGFNERLITARRFRIGLDGIVGHVAGSKIPIYVPDVSRDARYIETNPATKSEIALPLIVRDEAVGVLDVESDKLDYFTDDMIGLLALFAGQAAVALENARLYSIERRRMRQIEFINLIARSATAANDIDNLMLTLSELVSDTFEGTEVSILIREKSGLLRLHAHAGGEQPAAEPFLQSERHGIIGEALTARVNILVNDVAERRNWPACVPGTGSELCVPLQALGETMGVIVISHPKANAFVAEDRSIAQAAGDVCATAIKNVQLTDELRRVMNTDTVTGVFNQRYFHVAVSHELSRAKRFEQHFCIMMFDLHNFREMNKQFGFEGGDEVLRNVAHVLTSSVRSIDMVSRYSGDCFALILPETETSSLGVIRDKVIRALHRVATPKQGEFTSLQTIFASVSYPQDGTTELELIRHLLAELDRQKRAAATASA